MKKVMPPYRIKVVEPIKWNTREERERLIEQADFCTGFLKAEHIPINLETDSGTSAMSQDQWAGMMQGDESYFCGKNWYHLEKAVQDFTGYQYVLAAHQGRAAENIVCSCLINEPGGYSPANAHFGTTEVHARRLGIEPINLYPDEALDTQINRPFKGNIDLDKLEDMIKRRGAKNIPFLNMVLTNNFTGGQPVSMSNLKAASEIARKKGIPVVIDSARVAENAYFIKHREPGYENKSIREICREIYSYGDIMHMSSKKGALVNMGGLIATNDKALYERMGAMLIQFEGYITYGGLSGRDLEALAIGLNEGLEYDYLHHRISQVKLFGDFLKEKGVPFYEPAGGHGIYVDGLMTYPHIPKEELAAQAVCIQAYIESGVMGIENPSSLGWSRTDPETGKLASPPFELIRYAIPRRVYTDSQLEYAADGIKDAMDLGEKVKGFRIKWVPENEFLRIFQYRLERLT